MSVLDHRVQLGKDVQTRRGDSWFEQTGVELLAGLETGERNGEFEWRLWCCMCYWYWLLSQSLCASGRAIRFTQRRQQHGHHCTLTEADDAVEGTVLVYVGCEIVE